MSLSDALKNCTTYPGAAEAVILLGSNGGEDADIVAGSFQAPWGLFPHPARTAEEAGERLLHGISRAHAELFEPSPRRARIGTTLAALVACAGGMLSVAHVGNSRIYLVRRVE